MSINHVLVDIYDAVGARLASRRGVDTWSVARDRMLRLVEEHQLTIVEGQRLGDVAH